mmetsp:Transcript_20182/g.22446  ORF Transcript_20182/g.22446 Transcript_20182/m.22446 type:complete len:176 (+) Transcript_20182:45-572(+)
MTSNITNTLLTLPTELHYRVVSIDRHLSEIWPLLCFQTAVTSRFNTSLEKQGYWVKRETRLNRETIAEFKNGKRDGILIQQSLDGIKWIKCHYKEGKLHGEYKRFYRNGTIASLIRFEHGKRSGECREFHDNGQVADLYVYCDGKKIKHVCWDKNGQLYYRHDFINHTSTDHSLF